VELYRLWFLYCHGINSIFRLEGRVLVFPYTNSYQAENRARKEAELGKLRVLVSEQKVPLFSYYWYTSSVLLKCVTSLFAVNITSFITHQIFSSFSSDWSTRHLNKYSPTSQSSQFSESCALGKLFASRKR